MSSHQMRILAQKLAALERLVLESKQANLGYSTVEGGAIQVTDLDDSLKMVVGEQFDGTTTTASFNGPTPPTPGQPLVTAAPGGLNIYWDGTFEGGSPAPMDWSRVTMHVSTSGDPELLDPLDPSTIVGEVNTAVGIEIFASLPVDVEHFVFLVSWSHSGKFSAPSLPGFGTPTSPGSDPIIAPTSSPEIQSISGMPNALVIRTEPVADASVQVEYHISETEGFTPDSTTLAATSRATLFVATEIPGGGQFQPDIAYYVRTIATNAAGSAPASAEATGFIDLSAVREVVAEEVVAGFVLAGRIQVGQAYIDADEGIIIPQADGGRIAFPVNGDPAEITAHLVAQSLTTEGQTRFESTVDLLGPLILSEGVWTPSSAPSVGHYLPVQVVDVQDSPGNWPDYFTYGPVIDQDGNWVFVGKNSTESEGRIIVTDGETGARISTTHLGMVRPLGITMIGTKFYILVEVGPYSSLQRFVQRYDAVTHVKEGEWEYTNHSTSGYIPAIGTDGTNVIIAHSSAAQNAYVITFDKDTGVQQGPGIGPLGGSSYGTHFSSVWVGTADFGATRIVTVATQSPPNNIRVWNTSGVRQTAQEWNGSSTDPSGYVQGIWYGEPMPNGEQVAEGGNRFILYHRQFLHFCSNRTVDEAMSVAYSFYDSDPLGDPGPRADGTHETPVSPTASITLKKRFFLHAFATQSAPDVNDVDPTHYDRANQIKFYLDLGFGMKNQGALPVGERSLKTDNFLTAGSSPVVVNEFSGLGGGGYGFIESNVINPTTGWPTFRFEADGSGRVGPWIWDKDGGDQTDTGWIQVHVDDFENGWGNVNAGAYPARWRRKQGVLYIGGSITGGATGTTAFTLPPDASPQFQQRFGAAFSPSSGNAVVVIRPDGRVEPSMQAGTTNVSLDCSFPLGP